MSLVTDYTRDRGEGNEEVKGVGDEGVVEVPGSRDFAVRHCLEIREVHVLEDHILENVNLILKKSW